MYFDWMLIIVWMSNPHHRIGVLAVFNTHCVIAQQSILDNSVCRKDLIIPATRLL